MVSTADFPQADRLIQVGLVAEAISQGHYSDSAIENYIGLDSNGRQGRYYRRAAVVLGLISNNQNYSSLTAVGQEYSTLANPQSRIDFLARCLVDTPVFNNALRYIFSNKPSELQLKVWFRNFYPGEISTADRRYSTFLSYLRDAKLIDSSNGVLSISKYSGSIRKVPANLSQSPVNSKKQIVPLKTPSNRPNKTASDMITVDIDTQKLERANQIHWQLVDAKSSFLASRGFEPHEHAQIDLLAEYKNDSVFYEMKSIHSEGENLLPQIRKAIAQLYEYRYIFGQPTARLCIVTNQSIASKNNWLLEYLEKDRSIAYEWTDDFLNFNSHSDSKLLTGNFSP